MRRFETSLDRLCVKQIRGDGAVVRCFPHVSKREDEEEKRSLLQTWILIKVAVGYSVDIIQ